MLKILSRQRCKHDGYVDSRWLESVGKLKPRGSTVKDFGGFQAAKIEIRKKKHPAQRHFPLESFVKPQRRGHITSQ